MPSSTSSSGGRSCGFSIAGTSGCVSERALSEYSAARLPRRGKFGQLTGVAEDCPTCSPACAVFGVPMGYLPGGLRDDPCLFTEMCAWHQCCHPRGDRDRLRPEPPQNLGSAGMYTRGHEVTP